jgi:dihydropyrimidinase
VVHTSCRESHEAIARARANGKRVYGEPLIQHLLLDATEYENSSWNHAARRVMSPPFRAKAHQDSLWAGLQSGSLQVVATDHCAFTTEQKRLGIDDFRKIPNGTGGLEDRMPLLWTAAVNTGRLTKEEFVAVTSSNIARILNIYPKKGRLAAGSDADIVVWDPAASKTISASSQLSRIDYNVFEGYACIGAPVVTLSRGKLAWAMGELRAENGDGHYVERPPFSPVHVANSTWKQQSAPRAVRRADVTP